MTGMQLIIPPLEEDGSPHGDMAKNDSLTETEETTNTNLQNGEGVLSQELRESFEAMKAVWRQAGRDRGEDPAVTEELKRKEREQAIETALAVDSEVAKWQSGIAELEAMLASAEEEEEDEGEFSDEGEEDTSVDSNHHGRPLPAVRFPSLHPVVVPDDDEHEDDTSSRDDANY